MNKAPAFQTYPNDELADPDNLLRDWDARGMHMHFKCIAWNQHPVGSLPDNDDILRRWVGIPAEIDWQQRLRPQIFRGWERRDGRLFHVGLEREFEKQQAFRESRKHGAEARWSRDARAPSMQSTGNPLYLSLQPSSSQGEKIARPPLAARASTSKRSIQLADQEFIQELKISPAYAGIDIDRELAKIDAWLLTPKGRGKQKTRQRVVNWLNKIDRPLSSENSVAAHVLCTNTVLPPGGRTLRKCSRPVTSTPNNKAQPLCEECLAEIAAARNGHLKKVELA